MTGFKTEEVSYEIFYIKCAFPETIVNKDMEVIVEPKAFNKFLDDISMMLADYEVDEWE